MPFRSSTKRRDPNGCAASACLQTDGDDMMPVNEMNPKLANTWDMFKRAILGAALGATAFCALALFLPAREEHDPYQDLPVLGPNGEWLPDERHRGWGLPSGIDGSFLAAFSLGGVLIAVAGRNRFGRKTRATIIGMLIGGAAAGVLCGVVQPSRIAASSATVSRFSHRGVQHVTVTGCLVGAVAGFFVAAGKNPSTQQAVTTPPDKLVPTAAIPPPDASSA